LVSNTRGRDWKYIFSVFLKIFLIALPEKKENEIRKTIP
jgi:hypothetical protein